MNKCFLPQIQLSLDIAAGDVRLTLSYGAIHRGLATLGNYMYTAAQAHMVHRWL